MPRPYEPLAVANEFICFDHVVGASHMKLQKLVYCTFGWWFTRHPITEPLLNEEPEVWRHGPVFSSLYQSLAGFGAKKIGLPVANIFGSPPRVDPEDDEVHDLIRFIWGRYGHMSAFDLSDLTHKPGTPWHQIAEQTDYRVPRHTKIPPSMIRDEFERIRDRGRAA